MTATLPPVAPERFRQVFRRYPAGVIVVTADAGNGPIGFTATSLSSLSADPQLISFGIAETSTSWPHIRDAGQVVINFLAADQESVARRFATSGIDRFSGTEWRRLPGGSPVLEGVSGWLLAGVSALVPAGDHRVVIGAVEQAWLAESSTSLLYHDGGYRPL